MGQNTHIEEADNVLRIGAQVTLQIAKTVQNDDRSVRGHQDARHRGACGATSSSEQSPAPALLMQCTVAPPHAHRGLKCMYVSYHLQ